MYLYLGTLTLHENLFYATREIGRLYETGRYLHNYALTYALELAVAPYFHAEQMPRYAEQLQPLNQRGIYVTPARGTTVTYVLNTFKYADNHYHVEMQPGRFNTPSFGRAKEIAVGSIFHFAVLSEREELRRPRWMRLGLWRSKAEITWEVVEADKKPREQAEASLPLNPLDLAGVLAAFDLISMPPGSLLDHVTLQSEWWLAQTSLGPIRLPAGMAYTFPEDMA
ncbi:MAG: type I-D CRISPR-associated protein Cas5/Csc1 [Chloroflexi bacterium]|nr:type I-D CRISPR-associated protein Cas5/Csc1 [Chloroflexota bacterium]MCI0581072.1 type I-D CRISPR-associated protein Cas5/Csc1 [Chloroflexota bacterium]MCI0649464.1 type I-D CRISPR-associated protein Cas5/Csc1 [Chloroflexota bacterium]MCI0731865.1 type I-D CRISPR-associated protein Cas5/Csc1 [Chloroflexota bacterium]